MPAPIPFADALAAAETELFRLADRLDVPIQGLAVPCAVVLGISRQAAEVYRSLVRMTTAEPSGFSGPILLRSLADAAILLRWIEDAPSLRVAMYFAEDDRQRLASAKPFQTFRDRRAGGKAPDVFTPSEIAEMEANVRDVRTRAIAASEPIGAKGQLTPSAEAMAQSPGDPAMWEAYHIVYRVSSPSTHLGGRSLSHHRVASLPDGDHLVVESGYTGLAIRAMAAPLVAHLIGTSSRVCGLGMEGEAQLWQDAVVTWPAPLVQGIRP